MHPRFRASTASREGNVVSANKRSSFAMVVFLMNSPERGRRYLMILFLLVEVKRYLIWYNQTDRGCCGVFSAYRAI